MAYIPVPNTLRADVLGLIANQRIQNSFAVKYPTTPGDTERDNLETDFATFLASDLVPVLSNSYTVPEFDIVDISTEDGPKNVHVYTTPPQGAETVAAHPNNVAQCMTLRTAKRGRAYRGRSYIGGVYPVAGTTQIDSTADLIANLIGAFEALMTLINIGGKYYGVVSRYLDKVARVSAVVTPITAISADTHYDSQRRRLAGRGRV